MTFLQRYDLPLADIQSDSTPCLCVYGGDYKKLACIRIFVGPSEDNSVSGGLRWCLQPVKNKIGEEQLKRVVLFSESRYLNGRKNQPLSQVVLTVKISVRDKKRKSI